MKTCTYEQVKTLAADLAGIASGQLHTGEATMLRAFFSEELPDIWTREAWPELCDNIEAVTLDANGCFDTREGDADEMGDILAVIVGNDPRTSNNVTTLPRDRWTRLDDRVNILTPITGAGAIYVDWQTPAPDLLSVADGSLAAYTLPLRFRLALAARGAALLIADENPSQAGVLRLLAENALLREAARIKRPRWRA